MRALLAWFSRRDFHTASDFLRGPDWAAVSGAVPILIAAHYAHVPLVLQMLPVLIASWVIGIHALARASTKASVWVTLEGRSGRRHKQGMIALAGVALWITLIVLTFAWSSWLVMWARS